MEILTLAQASKRIPAIDGKRPHVATLYRWWSRGINGIHLECLKVGRKLGTTEENLNKFFVECGAAGPQPRTRRTTPVAPTKRTPQQREKAIRDAEAYLKANGAM